MRSFKKLGVLVAVFALSAIGAANASAAEFTASATGNISGKALETQVFTTNGGTVECTGATTTGTISSTASSEQHVTVNYSGCKAFGFANVHISPATYLFTANKTVHIKNQITITVTGFLIHCTVTVPANQSLGTVNFVQNGSKIRVEPHVTGITYTSSGGACGSSGSNGTYTGDNEVERAGGGSLTYHS